jgi:hypothetical protein
MRVRFGDTKTGPFQFLESIVLMFEELLVLREVGAEQLEEVQEFAEQFL